jgi:D-hexose-6-phosphate mutarotase
MTILTVNYIAEDDFILEFDFDVNDEVVELIELNNEEMDDIEFANWLKSYFNIDTNKEGWDYSYNSFQFL